MKKQFLGIVAVLVGVIALSVPVLAKPTQLQKIGKAIQYPFRKAGENISQTVHRTTGSKSVSHDRTHHVKYVVTPAGHKYPIHYRHRHHRMHRRHRATH